MWNITKVLKNELFDVLDEGESVTLYESLVATRKKGLRLRCVDFANKKEPINRPTSQRTIIAIEKSQRNTETHKTDWKPPITNHKQWPFEPVEVNFRFLRGPLIGVWNFFWREDRNAPIIERQF